MIDMRQYAEEIRKNTSLPAETFNPLLVEFLDDNDWFNIKCKFENEILFIDEEEADRHTGRIYEFFKNRELETKEKNRLLISKMKEQFPDTSELVLKFIKYYELPDATSYQMLNFLLFALPCEITEMDETEAGNIIGLAAESMQKTYGIVICELLSWIMENTATSYHREYFMGTRTQETERTKAYEADIYLKLMYLLFNEEHIKEEGMIEKAALSGDYAGTWLYLALHFVCALRDTDLARIYHPVLPYTPADVLKDIRNGTFKEADARQVLYSISWRLSVLPLAPNKTKKHTGISSVKLFFPESTETLFGTLFAAAEAHFQISRPDADVPLITPVKSYEKITKHMGEEVGALFAEADFSARRANKAYLQSIFLLADDVLDSGEESFNTKGYILAALARSHKGSYGEFAETTAAYLKDANLSGLTPELVARELFERGVLSFIPSMLLKMIGYDEYTKLPPAKQTELVKTIGLTPNEVNEIVSFSESSREKAGSIAKSILADSGVKKEKILEALHRIGNGLAPSKHDEFMCLMTGMGRPCPHPDSRQCLSCEYEISTKSTVYLIVSEYKRLKKEYASAGSILEKKKAEFLAKKVVIPALDETMQCMSEIYGAGGLASLEAIIREAADEQQ